MTRVNIVSSIKWFITLLMLSFALSSTSVNVWASAPLGSVVYEDNPSATTPKPTTQEPPAAVDPNKPIDKNPNKQDILIIHKKPEISPLSPEPPKGQ